ncbi:MAG: hypothetical protein AAF790_13395 [Planctomycetota bacterium]
MRLLLLAYAASLAGIAVLMDAGRLPGLKAWVTHEVPLGDKGAHFLVAGSLAALLNALMLRSFPLRPVRAVVLGSAIAAALVTAEELTNHFTPHRSCSPGDAAANCLGVVCLGVAPSVAWLVLRRRVPAHA